MDNNAQLEEQINKLKERIGHSPSLSPPDQHQIAHTTLSVLSSLSSNTLPTVLSKFFDFLDLFATISEKLPEIYTGSLLQAPDGSGVQQNLSKIFCLHVSEEWNQNLLDFIDNLISHILKQVETQPQTMTKFCVLLQAHGSSGNKANAKLKQKSFLLREFFGLAVAIGQGRYGHVFKGYNLRSGATVAIKSITINTNQSPQMFAILTRQLSREINAMKVLQNQPNIVHLYDVYLNNGNNLLTWNEIDLNEKTVNDHCTKGFTFMLVMEFIPGTFKDYLNTKRILPEDEALFFLKQIKSAFKSMHEKGIVHRDLKPDNILMASQTSDSIIKLGDFGFGRELSGAEVGNTNLGSPLYQAPEIVNQQQHTATVDLWSLGILLFKMLKGSNEYPFKSKRTVTNPFGDPTDMFDLVQRYESDSCLPLPNVSELMNDLLLKLLEPSDARISMSEFLAHALFADTFSNDMNNNNMNMNNMNNNNMNPNIVNPNFNNRYNNMNTNNDNYNNNNNNSNYDNYNNNNNSTTTTTTSNTNNRPHYRPLPVNQQSTQQPVVNNSTGVPGFGELQQQNRVEQLPEQPMVETPPSHADEYLLAASDVKEDSLQSVLADIEKLKTTLELKEATIKSLENQLNAFSGQQPSPPTGSGSSQELMKLSAELQAAQQHVASMNDYITQKDNAYTDLSNNYKQLQTQLDSTVKQLELRHTIEREYETKLDSLQNDALNYIFALNSLWGQATKNISSQPSQTSQTSQTSQPSQPSQYGSSVGGYPSINYGHSNSGGDVGYLPSSSNNNINNSNINNNNNSTSTSYIPGLQPQNSGHSGGVGLPSMFNYGSSTSNTGNTGNSPYNAPFTSPSVPTGFPTQDQQQQQQQQQEYVSSSQFSGYGQHGGTPQSGGSPQFSGAQQPGGSGQYGASQPGGSGQFSGAPQRGGSGLYSGQYSAPQQPGVSGQFSSGAPQPGAVSGSGLYSGSPTGTGLYQSSSAPQPGRSGQFSSGPQPGGSGQFSGAPQPGGSGQFSGAPQPGGSGQFSSGPQPGGSGQFSSGAGNYGASGPSRFLSAPPPANYPGAPQPGSGAFSSGTGNPFSGGVAINSSQFTGGNPFLENGGQNPFSNQPHSYNSNQ